jgi:acetylornithine deacetylase
MCYRRRTYPNAITIAEKGLLVLDVKIKGTPSHAHQNDDNAIYKTIPVMEWFKTIPFDKISEQLGLCK